MTSPTTAAGGAPAPARASQTAPSPSNPSQSGPSQSGQSRSGAATATDTTVIPIIMAVALGHMLNDLMQSLISASYPLLKTNLALTFTQIGIVTFVFQGTSSILQPLVGFYTDRRPLPYAMAAAMAATGLGLLSLAFAQSYGMVLVSVALIGLGSAVFHPEASRIARLAGGKRPGFAQSMFQVGGNFGTSLGPLAAAFVVMARGQTSISWFMGVALVAMVLLFTVGRWYVAEGAGRAKARRAGAPSALPKATVGKGMGLVFLLMFSKNFYLASFTTYFTFYLMAKFGVSADAGQVGLFLFLAGVALGTMIGGPIGDRIGRRKVILVSILGTLPFAVALPWMGLYGAIAMAVCAGIVIASAFPAMVVYAQDLLPQHTGMVAGLMFGVSFGLGAIGAACLGALADAIGIVNVYHICAFLPAIGLLAMFLPEPK